MRVLIIGINYRPEPTGIGPYTAGLAEHLAARGDEVTVVTGLPSYPGWRLMHGGPRRLLTTERVDGVTVIRAAHYIPASQTAVKRALYEGTFGLTALLASLRLDRPDAILGVVPSLSGGILARLTGQRLRPRTGSSSRTSWAGGPTVRDRRRGTVARATGTAEAWAAAGARAIGVVADTFIPYLASIGVPAERITHVPTGCASRPSLTRAETRRRFGWPDDRQVILHAAHGLKQGLEQVVEAGRLAAERGEPSGSSLRGRQPGTGTAGSGGRSPHDRIPSNPAGRLHASLLAAADVLFLSERATQLDMSLPSKLTSYFAAGRRSSPP